jgi:plastocyanin
VVGYSFVAAQNVTSTTPAPTGNATTGNVTGGDMTATGNATGDNETAPAAGETNSFIARGQVASVISDDLLGGKWKIDVIDRNVERVQINMTMAKQDGSDFHTLLIDNFTAGAAANDAGDNLTAPAGNVTAPGNETAPTNETAGSQTPSAPAAGGGAEVSIVPGSATMSSGGYDPDPVEISVGDTVTWTNDDSTPHTITSGSNGQPDGKFDSSPNMNPLMAPGDTFEHTFTEAGEYPYYCALHPNLVGTVSVS